jgi:hypothetical protein
MANVHGEGTRREEVLFMRLSHDEKNTLRREAKKLGLTMDEYARCKVMDYDFHPISGRLPKPTKPTKPQKPQP